VARDGDARQNACAGAFGDDMLRFIVPALALFAAPTSFAQTTFETTAAEDLPPAYFSLGFAWSGELGLELEAGFQANVGDLRLSLAPLNLSLFDGDLPAGFFWDDSILGRDCREVGSNDLAFDDECQPETDSELRSVAEAQMKVGEGFRLGAGVAYLLQGDFKPEDGRVAAFASFAWEDQSGSALELRAGSEYVALRLRGLW
jgi:hypothetical protein